MTPEQAAGIAQVRAAGYLDHPEAIDYLEAADSTLVDYNDAGNPVIHRKVLAAMKRLQPDDVVWSRSELHWRLRDPDDEAGRLVP